MEANMDSFLDNIEAEHNSLTDQVNNFETEVFRLSHENEQLQKALQKQKQFHRNFADEVAAMEKVRIRDFNEEKRSLSALNKTLIKENRQLNIDVTFYKQAHQELVNRSEAASSSQLCQRTASNSSLPASPPPLRVRVTRKTTKSAATATSEPENISYRSAVCVCKQTSSKTVKNSTKMFEEIKKLKSKISTLSTTIAMLKKENKRLESFRIKIDNKKLKFQDDSVELERLVRFTKKSNKNTFNAEALSMLKKIVQ